METLFFLFRSLIVVALDALLFAMLLRAIISIFFFEEENKFTNFIFYITEPFIIPVRAVMQKFNILQDSPIDFSFMITSMLISILSLIL